MAKLRFLPLELFILLILVISAAGTVVAALMGTAFT